MGESTPLILKCRISTLPSVAAGRVDGVSITMCGLQRSPKESKRFLEIWVRLILILLLFMRSPFLEKKRRMWDVLFPSMKFWPCDIWCMYITLLKLLLYCIFWGRCLVCSPLGLLSLSPVHLVLLCYSECIVSGKKCESLHQVLNQLLYLILYLVIEIIYFIALFGPV